MRTIDDLERWKGYGFVMTPAEANKMPETKLIHKESFKTLYNKILLQEFILDWEENLYKVKSKAIMPIIIRSKKATVLFILSLLIPYPFFKYLNNKRLLLS